MVARNSGYDELDAIQDVEQRYRRFVEINIYEQCRNVIKTAEVQKSYHKYGFPKVAGWVFDIGDAQLKDLNFDFQEELRKVNAVYRILDGSPEDDEILN